MSGSSYATSNEIIEIEITLAIDVRKGATVSSVRSEILQSHGIAVSREKIAHDAQGLFPMLTPAIAFNELPEFGQASRDQTVSLRVTKVISVSPSIRAHLNRAIIHPDKTAVDLGAPPKVVLPVAPPTCVFGVEADLKASATIRAAVGIDEELLKLNLFGEVNVEAGVTLSLEFGSDGISQLADPSLNVDASVGVRAGGGNEELNATLTHHFVKWEWQPGEDVSTEFFSWEFTFNCEFESLVLLADVVEQWGEKHFKNDGDDDEELADARRNLSAYSVDQQSRLVDSVREDGPGNPATRRQLVSSSSDLDAKFLDADENSKFGKSATASIERADGLVELRLSTTELSIATVSKKIYIWVFVPAPIPIAVVTIEGSGTVSFGAYIKLNYDRFLEELAALLDENEYWSSDVVALGRSRIDDLRDFFLLLQEGHEYALTVNLGDKPSIGSN